MSGVIRFFHNQITYFIGLALCSLATYYSFFLIEKWNYAEIGGIAEYFKILTTEGFALDFGLGLSLTLLSTMLFFVLSFSSIVAFEDYIIPVRVFLGLIPFAIGIFQFTQLMAFITATFFIGLIGIAGFFILSAIAESS